MKRLVLMLAVAGMILSGALTVVQAKGTPDVANTWHNLSSSGPVIGFTDYTTNASEICVFCHTPHGGNTQGPLWNKNLPGAASFTHYTSVTLSSYLQGLGTGRAVNDESLLCLSCHDGTISVNHLLNDPNSLNGTPIATGWNGDPNTTIVDLFGGPSALIGTDLTDDHPISFSYDSVLTEYNGGTRAGQLRDVATATSYAGEGVRFFAPGNRVECSSCHDPHVDYNADPDYSPFLIMPNTGSNLCLACHNK